MSSLVCITENVNRKCCRTPDGGRAGNWFYPDGSMVDRSRNNSNSIYRKFHKHQVRLVRIRNVVDPLGSYTCVVSDTQGNYVNASIRIGKMCYNCCTKSIK